MCVFNVHHFISGYDDPLSAFEKILREKDMARERHRRRKRSFSRSPSPRPRSRTRSPLPHRKRSAQLGYLGSYAWEPLPTKSGVFDHLISGVV